MQTKKFSETIKNLNMKQNTIKGTFYELYVGDRYRKHYEEKYSNINIEYRGILLGKKDEGIDIIITYEKNNKNHYTFVQCKNLDIEKKNSITYQQIKTFLYDCIKYAKIHNIPFSQIRATYIVPDKDLYKRNAIKSALVNNENFKIKCSLAYLEIPTNGIKVLDEFNTNNSKQTQIAYS